ncbi:MAG: nucleoside triphosphate pyrophosphohydrolase [Pseudomonadota bacterium]|jgi:ATP diphosphatase
MTHDLPPLDAVERLLHIMRRLRDPDSGCPWDLQQSFATIAPHTLEEVYEVIDAIESGDMEQLRGELGDLLFQVVFYAQLGTEAQLFDFNDIAAGIGTKLLHRHPHVFPSGSLEVNTRAPELSADQVVQNWEAIKTAERQHKQGNKPGSALDDVPLALSSLLRAVKLQKRAAGQGFDWRDTEGVFAKVEEELAELRQALKATDQAAVEEEFGDLMFTLVNLSRHLDLNPESALRAANRKFEERFRSMEEELRRAGRDMRDLNDSELDNYWNNAKLAGKNPSA